MDRSRTNLDRILGGTASCALVVLVGALSGCNADAGAVEEADLTGPAQGFDALPNSDTYLMTKVISTASEAPALRICLTGTAVTSSKRGLYEAALRQAIMAWADAVRDISTRPVLDAEGITFGCPRPGSADPPPHATIHWSSEASNFAATGCTTPSDTCRIAHVSGGNFMQLYRDDGDTLKKSSDGRVTSTDEDIAVLTHEAGHLFGLNDTYISGSTACKPGQPSSLLCDVGKGDRLRDDDITGAREVFCAVYPQFCRLRWSQDLDWCAGEGKVLSLGNFDADQRTDMLCHERTTGHIKVLLARDGGFVPGYSGETSGWCAGDTLSMLVGDIDRDGLSDLICHDSASGQIQSALAGSGTFAFGNWSDGLDFCAGGGTRLVVGDFDGDARADLLCQGAGALSMAVADAVDAGAFLKSDWSSSDWCGGQSILIADFDRDRRSDLFCVGDTGKKLQVATASKDKHGFQFKDRAAAEPAFKYNVSVGDFNGDRSADLLRFGPDDRLWVTYADASGRLNGLSREWSTRWCTDAEYSSLMGDFDANGTSDIFCHNRDTGVVKIAFGAYPTGARLGWTSATSASGGATK